MNKNVENNMTTEYIIVMSVTFAYGLFTLFIPIGITSPLWSKWLTVCVSALCGWFLWQRKNGEKMIMPLIACWMAFIAGLAALIYVPDTHIILEIIQILSPDTIDAADSVRSMQQVFSFAWIGALGVYLSVFSHFGRIKGRKTMMPFICGSLTVAVIFCGMYLSAHDTRLTVTPSLILVSMGFLRLSKLERYEHL
jgi:hypothetical protein